MKENGRSGKCSKNKNGSYDCGLAQINTDWAAYFQRFGISYAQIAKDACLNIQASAYILRTNYNLKSNDWFYAVVSYNIGPNRWTPGRYAIGHRYATAVVNQWWGFHRWVGAQQSTVFEAPGATAEAVSAN